VHLDAVEHGDSIAFLHAVQEGAANRSYGLQVASLAGVPKQVVSNAKQKLLQLEQQSELDNQQPQQQATTLQTSMDFEPVASHPAVDLLKDVDPDDLTPKQALALIYQLRDHL